MPARPADWIGRLRNWERSMASSGCSSSSMASSASWVAWKMGSLPAKVGAAAGRASGSGAAYASASGSGSGDMAARMSLRTFSGMEPPSYTGR